MNTKQIINSWQGWTDEDYEASFQQAQELKEKQVRAKANKAQAEDLRNVAWKLYKAGYYSFDDYNQFCFKNKILIF